jgi:hypothetical protein
MYSSLIGGEAIILIILFSVLRSITGLVVLIIVVRTYGGDLVIE